MGEVIFCATNDGSVGLYNEVVGDIYHSSYGAYGESYEKFLCASGFLDYIKNNDKVSILDICYGIGYNTKTALDEILKLDKIIETEIDALEYDENLINISPLLKNQKIDNEINKFLINNSNLDFSRTIFQTIKYFIQTRGINYINWHNFAKLSKKLDKRGVFLYLLLNLIALPHNIYYNYIANRNKKGSKSSKLAKTSIVFHSDDARKSVLKLNTKYNFIFLDAFTPKKLPTLWSLEFFKELYRLLEDDGVLVTYSSSAAIRAAMIEAGFFVGRSISKDGKIIGTIATKKETFIKHKLESFDLALLKSTAGVFYRDENLNGLPEAIIKRRDDEAKNSGRITSSRLKKTWKEPLT